jgi:predicted phosphodiesterase
MNKLRVISDVHGKVQPYLDICRDAEAKGYETIQIGDLGFSKTYWDIVGSALNLKKHKFFRGNHDDYYCDYLHRADLGDFGPLRYGGFPKMFFVRGEFSIDKQYREVARLAGHPRSWWSEEELTEKQMDDCFDAYLATKPDILISHGCPTSVARLIGDPEILKNWDLDPETFETRTERLLESLVRIHKPKVVIHGHFHVDHDTKLDDVRYIGLGELKFVDINKDGTCESPHTPLIEQRND